MCVLAPALMLAGCRQLLAIDEERPLLSEELDGGGVEAEAATDATAEGGSPFSVFNAVPSGEALVAIWGAGPDSFVAVGTSSVAYVYDNGTLTRLGGTQQGRDYLAVWGFSKTDVFAVGQTASGGFVDHFDGKGWTAVFDTPSALLGVWGSSQGAGAVLAVGTQGNIYGFTPGQAWKTFDKLPKAPGDPSVPGAPRLWGISGRNLDDFSIAADSRFYHYEPDAGGFAFYEPTAQTNTLFRSVWQQAGGAGTNVYFGTNFFGLLYFSGRGSETSGYPGTVLFRDEATPGAEESFIQGVWGTSEKVIAVGDRGRIYVYDTGLSTPSPIPSPTDEPLGGVWGSSIDDVWIVGRRELILHGSIR